MAKMALALVQQALPGQECQHHQDVCIRIRIKTCLKVFQASQLPQQQSDWLYRRQDLASLGS